MRGWVAAAVGLLLLMGGPAWAETRPVVFLELPGDAATLARQAEVEQELELSLDVVRLDRAPTPTADFAEQPLPAQLDALSSVLVGDVLAALWVDPSSADPVRVQIAFAGEGGRTEVRIVEEPAGPGAVSVLALGVREVLASAVAPAPVAEETISPPPAAPRTRYGAIGADFVLEVGTPLSEGPPVSMGLVLAGEGRFPRGVLLGPVLDWRMGADASGELFTTSVGGGVRVGALFGEAVRLGPFGGVTVQAHFGWLRTGEGPLLATNVLVRLPVGLAVRVPLDPARRVELAVHAGIELLPRRLQVRRRSTGEIVIDTGPMVAALQVGLRFLP